MFVAVNFDALAEASDFLMEGDKLSSSAECMIPTQCLWNRIYRGLNAHRQTGWALEDQTKTLNSVARLYD